jgi:hypothetical protein
LTVLTALGWGELTENQTEDLSMLDCGQLEHSDAKLS